jgi:hypothetical protein
MDTATLRQHITQRFNDEDLQIFCYDHYRQVYESFTNGQTKGERVQALIEHVERGGGLARLAMLVGLEHEPTRVQMDTDSNICVQILQARARLNTLLDVAERLDSMPGWLRDKIQVEHDVLHDLKIKIMRL